MIWVTGPMRDGRPRKATHGVSVGKNDPLENANLKQMLLSKSVLSTVEVNSFKVFIFASLKDDTLDSVALQCYNSLGRSTIMS